MKSCCNCLKKFKMVKKFAKPPLTTLVKTIPNEVQEKAFTDTQLAMIADQLLIWPHKAVGLGLSESEIENIKEDHKTSNQLQKIALMMKWAKMNGDQANLKELIRVSKLNRWDAKFIRKICKELGYGKGKRKCQLGVRPLQIDFLFPVHS